MNINRHNYEEFFLLYVDKELSAAEQKAVNVFVQQNPDLKMELALLQQTVVNADDIVLHKKDWLYKEEEITALQQNLLLYADDELSAADKNAVESLLNTNAAAKAEWAVLQQTKLKPDMAVVFEDKQLLYRKEGGRVVEFKWWRVAAAAVLLGFGLWGGVSFYKNNFQKRKGSEVAVKENKITPAKEKTDLPVADKKETAAIIENVTAENSTITSRQNNAEPDKNIKAPVEKINTQPAITPQQNITLQNGSNKKPVNNLPKSYLDNINKNGSNETAVTNVSSENNSNRVSGNNDAVVKINPKENKINVEDVNVSKSDANIAALQVVNTDKTAEGENNARYLNVDNNKEKRSALAGFIRKAKRVLERTTNVKTGEGVKIAGFEIALK
jgi:ribosomal protein L24